MLSYAIAISFAIMSVAMMFNLYRLVIGPDMPDRVVALDTMYINSIALIVLFGMYLGSDLFFEAALLIAVMGFVGTVSVAKYLMHGDIIE